MRPTTSYDDMIRRQIASDPAFASALFKEAVMSLFDGDFRYGLTRLRDIVKAGMGFSALSEAVGISSQNLHRALSARGNPTIKTLNRIVAAIAKWLGIEPVAMVAA